MSITMSRPARSTQVQHIRPHITFDGTVHGKPVTVEMMNDTIVKAEHADTPAEAASTARAWARCYGAQYIGSVA